MTFDRRRFLAGAGLVAAATAVGACTEGNDAESADPPDGGRPSETDLDFVEFAAGLEVLAVESYRSSLDAAVNGKLGQVPAALSEFLQVAHDQHNQVLETINGILDAEDHEPVTSPNTAARQALVEPGLAEATEFLSVVRVVRNLESALAATYLRAAQSDLQA
ncbi:MAG: twin-arginine translocation signal domain-containing protein, partial [Actinobacteria bacterium]|nr:twin-arginine translocation signal domain-containing protein [Actinomycetota bacterium]